MSVNSVSFGKIVFVKAPLKVAEEIAAMANSHKKTDISKPVKSVINDSMFGKAIAYQFPDSQNISYIFSGKEGRKFRKITREAKDRIDFANDYFRDKKIAKIDIDFTRRRYGECVEELIDSSENIPVMGVEYNKSGSIKSVNVIA